MKEIVIEENDTQYQEIGTTKLFTNGNTNEFDVVVVDLMEKKGTLSKEVKNLKRE